MELVDCYDSVIHLARFYFAILIFYFRFQVFKERKAEDSKRYQFDVIGCLNTLHSTRIGQLLQFAQQEPKFRQFFR